MDGFWPSVSFGLGGLRRRRASIPVRFFLCFTFDGCVHDGAYFCGADPYHTYLSLAALAIFPVADEPGFDESFELARLDPLLNATEETARWAREHIPASREDGQVDGVS